MLEGKKYMSAALEDIDITLKTEASPDEDGEILDDDLDERIDAGEIPLADTDSYVQAAVDSGSDLTVTLWRGCPLAAAQNMWNSGAAGGILGREGAPPSLGKDMLEAERKKQIKGEKGSVLPEFAAFFDDGSDEEAVRSVRWSNVRNVAKGFSSGQSLVVVEIEVKWLSRGSRSECGWVCDKGAPVRIKKIVDRGCIPPLGLGRAAAGLGARALGTMPQVNAALNLTSSLLVAELGAVQQEFTDIPRPDATAPAVSSRVIRFSPASTDNRGEAVEEKRPRTTSVSRPPSP
jgi:hypothetical protein